MQRAIVLGGGGARGAYHIGVWKALKACRIDYDIITGTSIGALNGILMVQNDFEKAVTLWDNISTEQVIKLSSETLTTNTAEENLKLILKEILLHNGLDTTPLEALIMQVLDVSRLRNTTMQMGLVTVEYPQLRPILRTIEEIPDAELLDYLMASAACRPAFKLREFNGQKFVDGCYYDNLPINLAIALGAEEVIAVDLHAFGIKQPPKDNISMVYIDCYWDLGNTLMFDKTLAARNMQLGYNDGLKAFNHCIGYGYTFQSTEAGAYVKRYYQLLLVLYVLENNLEPELFHSLTKDLQHRIDALSTRRGANANMIDVRLKVPLLLAEICAEIWDVVETPIYTLEEFELQILQCVNHYCHTSGEENFSEYIKEKFTGGQSKQTIQCYLQLKHYLNTPQASINCLSYPFLTIIPDAFWAGLYLLLLLS